MPQSIRKSISLAQPLNDEIFEESAYLAANPDVALAVSQGVFKSGRTHFHKHGRSEGRSQKTSASLLAEVRLLRAEKLRRLTPHLKRPPVATRVGGALDYLDAESRARHGLDDMDVVSRNNYDDETMRMIENCDGLVLDAGAGFRTIYFDNVVNYEIFDYDSTDVLGACEDMPFEDKTFDGVLSIAVLEHVRDPFRCASEIARVLKPGGWLKCCVPFLQPLHGYPHHYYNMTHEGLRALFAPYLEIERQEVTDALHPVWSISWQLRAWVNALPPKTQKQFLRMRVEDLIGDPTSMIHQPYAQDLPMATRFELATATLLIARKPDR